jgi:hypothetical protein
VALDLPACPAHQAGEYIAAELKARCWAQVESLRPDLDEEWWETGCPRAPSTSLGLCFRHGRELLGEGWAMKNHGVPERL